MKKIIYAVPALAAASAFAQGAATNGLTQQTVTDATSDLVTFGGYVVGGIGAIIAVSAGLRLLVKGINRAVGK